MIITKTPFRVSFCGGGSDLKAFYEKQEGCVISATGELVVSVTDGEVDRFRDEAGTGLNLFSFKDGTTL